MKLFNFKKNKSKDKSKTKGKKSTGQSKFGLFKNKDDFIGRSGIGAAVESALISTMQTYLNDDNQPYIAIDQQSNLIYLIALTNDLIKGSMFEQDSEALGSLQSATENANKNLGNLGDVSGSVYNASFSSDLNPEPNSQGDTPPKQLVFLPTINTLNELETIAGPDQEYEIVSLPSDISESNYLDYENQGRINAPLVENVDTNQSQSIIKVTIAQFKDFVKENTTQNSATAYTDPDDKPATDDEKLENDDSADALLEDENLDDVNSDDDMLPDDDFADDDNFDNDDNPEIDDADFTNEFGNNGMYDDDDDLSSDDAVDDSDSIDASADDDAANTATHTGQKAAHVQKTNKPKASTPSKTDDLDDNFLDSPEALAAKKEAENGQVKPIDLDAEDDDFNSLDLDEQNEDDDFDDFDSEPESESEPAAPAETVKSNEPADDDSPISDQDFKALNDVDDNLDDVLKAEDADSTLKTGTNTTAKADTAQTASNAAQKAADTSKVEDTAKADETAPAATQAPETTHSEQTPAASTVTAAQTESNTAKTDAAPTATSPAAMATPQVSTTKPAAPDLTAVQQAQSSNFIKGLTNIPPSDNASAIATEPTSEDEALVDVTNPEISLAQIDPSIKKMRNLTESNRKAREQLRSAYSKRVDDWLKRNLQVPVLYTKDGAKFGKKFLIEQNADNDLLRKDVESQRSQIKTRLMNEIDEILDGLTDPAEFDDHFPQVAEKLRNKFLNKKIMQQEQIERINSIYQMYQQLHEGLRNQALEQAENEYNTKYIPQRDQEITSVEQNVKKEHQKAHSDAIDRILESMREKAKPLVDDQVKDIILGSQDLIDTAALNISSQVRAYSNDLYKAVRIYAEMNEDNNLDKPAATDNQNTNTLSTREQEGRLYEKQRDLELAQQQIASLKHQQQEKQSDIENLQTILASSHSRESQLQEQIKKYRKDIAAIEAEKTIAAQRANSYQQTNSVLRDELTNIQSHGSKGDDLNFSPNTSIAVPVTEPAATMPSKTAPLPENEHYAPKSSPAHAPQL